jgi:alpha-beta hydrolase superfamily lysophospholipase
MTKRRWRRAAGGDRGFSSNPCTSARGLARSLVLDLVIERLSGVDVRTIALPSSGHEPSKLGDLYNDAEIVRSVVADVEGPVVICAHSYGGAPVTEALVGMGKVRHLVTSVHGRAT